MSDVDARRKLAGRIGGLRAWSRNDAEVMTSAAHRAFRARFERMVDPDGVLDPAEREKRADRARRAHMLELSQRSAAVRRARRIPPVPEADGDAAG